ncbi:hypothetical protein SLNSH_00750 [Alsobacter soli]|uniref:Mucoidy inhibitor MuiA family protein n=1 Tax=Alsobacter soli TaxID=2109933 RepID=A0A2T1HZ23_9HYPH|nr:mucoidy inhibitor MuiA family protein [Alsobacter soli]PSC06946.1 hypothetical protein SLNSH_00750 [Alsobacter soli]
MRRAFAILLLSGVSTTALAADVEAPSRVDAVTVFPDGASVIRVLSVSLPAGASTVVVRGLSASLDPASVRVQGQADGELAIGAVETRPSQTDIRPALDAELEKRIDALRAERDGIAGQIEAAELKRRAIETYATASPEKLGPEAKPLDIAQWSAAWDAVGEGATKVNEALRQLRAKAKDLDQQIAALESARPKPTPPGAPRRDLTVAVETGQAVSGELRITYRVAAANWRPLYDVRLDTGAKDRKPSLELARRAQVTQRTGEDWTDVALSVSTTRTLRGTAAPDVPPLVVNLLEPQAVAMDSVRGRAKLAESERQMAAPAPGAPARMAAAPPVEAVEQVAQIEAGDFQAAFRVPGRVTLPRDGAPKSFTLGSRKAEPTLLAKIAPALDETAYLEASLVNEEEAPILPGEVSLHRDGVYVGKGRLKLVAPGDRIELGFGADDRIKVTRAPVKRKENEPGWIGNTKTEQREFKTTVRNLHDSPLRISVVDRAPVSENTAVTVEALPGTPPTEKAIADKRGVMGWTWDYAPGEQKEIRFGYRLKWPADRDIVMDGGGPVPLAR